MSNNLKDLAISGLFWSLILRYSQQLIVFSVAIVLARILLPAEFGIVSMLGVFMALAQTFLDFGISAALIQRQDIDQRDLSTVFYLNILTGFVLTLILFLSAPLIANFYSEPELVGITRFMSLNFIIISFGIVQNTLITKRVDFKIRMKISLPSLIISGVVAVYLAFNGFGVWSLAIQVVLQSFLHLIFLWYVEKWRPTLQFSISSIKKIIGFSANIFGSSMLDTFFKKLDVLLVGKFFNPADLGFYTRAVGLQQLPIRNTHASIKQVMYPVLSKMQDDNVRLKRAIRKIIKVVAFVGFPMLLGMLVVADPLIRVLITEKWLPSVKYLQLLCIGGLVYSISAVNLNILLVKGKADIFLKLEIVKKIMTMAGLFIGILWGIMGLIIGRIIVGWFAFILNIHYSGKQINYTVIEQLKDLLPYFILSIIMAVSVYFLGTTLGDNYNLKLFVEITAGVLIYYIIAKFFKLDGLTYLSDIIKEKYSQKKLTFSVWNGK